MEISTIQNDEIYNTVFSEDVEKALDEIENNPDFADDVFEDPWFGDVSSFNTKTKTIIVYSKYVKGNEVQYQQTVTHVNKEYSRWDTLNTIKGSFTDQLIQNRAAPEGFTLEGRGIKIVTEYPGWLLKSSVVTSTIYHRVDET